MHNEMKQIGEVIRRRRVELGLSQVDLALMIDVEKSTISRWENGQGYPEQGLIVRVAIALGITTDELLCVKDVTDKNKKKHFKWIIRILLLFVAVFLVGCGICLFVDRGASLVEIDLKSVSIYHNKIFDIFILSILVTFDIIFIFFKRARAKILLFQHQLKYKHKFPAGYDFQIRKGYFAFLCILLLALTSLMLIIVIV